MLKLEFTLMNNWSAEDLSIEDCEDEVINHLVSNDNRGINLYIGDKTEKIYDVWLDEIQ